MAENRGAWGIDIGQAGLKAIRLRYADAADQVIAVAFDYVPHPKILSQPDAVPEELIPQALEKFLSRNEVAGDAVAISVPGQTALARFIQLPPVEASKVAEIVKYEARQQIPFALEDVIWDYQTLGGGVEESGYMLEAEVGLFAMKREQVQQHLQPFTDAKIEPDLIQIAPLALYNVLSYDQLGIRLGGDFEATNDYTIVLDMGADNTTLLVSNGEKIWIRNVPIGGNHFTRALTKEMKLTFAKAEHLKCNATKSPDPRAVFQALRPVFNDYVSEIQRSIGYFSSVNRDAKIVKILGTGNGFKLAGLQKFLQQNLQYPVERVDTFGSLVGDAVLKAPLFQENVLSFAVPYGLALQAMNLTRIHTTLLPPELAMARKIRAKKPWAIVAAASLLFGFSLSAAGYANVWKSVNEERWGGGSTPGALKEVSDLKSEVDSVNASVAAEEETLKQTIDNGQKLVQNANEREYWLEIYKAINVCLPRDTEDQNDNIDITKRNRIKLLSVTAVRNPNLAQWFAAKSKLAYVKPYMAEAEFAAGPSGLGFVFTLRGVHYHHEEDNKRRGRLYVVNTLLKNLQSWAVPDEDSELVPVGQIGISHAMLTVGGVPTPVWYNPAEKGAIGVPGQDANEEDEDDDADGDIGEPDAAAGLDGVAAGGEADEGNDAEPDADDPREAVRRAMKEENSKTKEINRTEFEIKFVWRKTPKSNRKEKPPEAASATPAVPPQ